MAGKEKCSWIVTIERVVRTEVIAEDCTEEQARENPYEYCVDERDVDTIDYDVKSVELND